MKIDKESIELYAQGLMSLLIAAAIAFSGMFQTGRSIFLLGVVVAICLVLYFKLMSMRTKGNLSKSDSISRLLTWIIFIIFGGIGGWLLLIICKMIEIICFLVKFIISLANS